MVDLEVYKKYLKENIDCDGYIDPSYMIYVFKNELKEKIDTRMSIYEIVEFVNSKELNMNSIKCSAEDYKSNYVKNYIEILKEKSIKLLYIIERIQDNKENRFNHDKVNEYLWERISYQLTEYDIKVDEYGYIYYPDMIRLVKALIENIQDLYNVLVVVDFWRTLDKAYDVLLDKKILYPIRSLQDKSDLVDKRGCIPLSDKQKHDLQFLNCDIFDTWMNSVVSEKVKCKRK